MSLSQYDDQCLRITDTDGTAYEGICRHNSAEYNFHEFGRDEECLQMVYMLFFPNDIAELTSLEGRTGPYGRFTERYGALEKAAAESGMDLIDEVFYCEEDEHVCRMLLCLEDYLDPARALPGRGEIIAAVRKLRKDRLDPASRAAADRIIEKWG